MLPAAACIRTTGPARAQAITTRIPRAPRGTCGRLEASRAFVPMAGASFRANSLTTVAPRWHPPCSPAVQVRCIRSPGWPMGARSCCPATREADAGNTRGGAMSNDGREQDEWRCEEQRREDRRHEDSLRQDRLEDERLREERLRTDDEHLRAARAGDDAIYHQALRAREYDHWLARRGYTARRGASNAGPPGGTLPPGSPLGAGPAGEAADDSARPSGTSNDKQAWRREAREAVDLAQQAVSETIYRLSSPYNSPMENSYLRSIPVTTLDLDGP